MNKSEPSVLETLSKLDCFIKKYIVVAANLLNKETLTKEEQEIIDITDEIDKWMGI